jgi:hypothetical protein
LVAVAGAQAADMPVKAAPVQYVKICSLYGDGFFYIPNTDTCIKMGGYARVQAETNMGGGGVPVGDSAPPFIFFDGAPNFGFANGTVNVTLAAARHLVKDGVSMTDAVAVAHLRCNIPAAIELRAALDSALLLAAKAGGAAH